MYCGHQVAVTSNLPEGFTPIREHRRTNADGLVLYISFLLSKLQVRLLAPVFGSVRKLALSLT